MTRHDDLEGLFVRWREHWAENHVIDKFVPDGIGDEAAWSSCPRKLLWVLREPNDTSPTSNQWDLRTFLQTPAWAMTDQKRSGTTWSNIARCSYGIILHPCTFENAEANFKTSAILRRIAVMNIKKAPGFDRVVWRELKCWAARDAAFIREEVEIIDPQIIVCGGTLDYLCDALGVLYDKEAERVQWRNKVIVGWGHPGTDRVSENITTTSSDSPAIDLG